MTSERCWQFRAQARSDETAQQVTRACAPILHCSVAIQEDVSTAQRLFQAGGFGALEIIQGDIHSRGPDTYTSKEDRSHLAGDEFPAASKCEFVRIQHRLHLFPHRDLVPIAETGDIVAKVRLQVNRPSASIPEWDKAAGL